MVMDFKIVVLWTDEENCTFDSTNIQFVDQLIDFFKWRLYEEITFQLFDEEITRQTNREKYT